MTNKIKKILEKYPRPDQTLLPEIILTWRTSAGHIWLDCKTGNKIKNPDIYNYGSIGYRNMDSDIICVNSGATLKYAYCKYHSSAKLLEFAVVAMSSNRTGGARFWEYIEDGERYFIDKDKHIYTADGEKSPNSTFRAYKYHETYRFDLYLNMITRCSYSTKNFMGEFKKLVGKDMIAVGNGRVLKLDHPYYITEWYKLKPYKESNGKVQKLLNEVTSLPHKDLTDICLQHKPLSYKPPNSSWNRNLNDVIYFEHLSDEWSVLRYCIRSSNDSNIESYRIYIAEDGTCKMAKLNDCGRWISAKTQMGTWRRSSGRIVNFEDMTQSKRLSYITPILEKIDIDKQADCLALIVKFPQIEKLYKLGYDKLAYDLISNGTVNADIKARFGDINKNAKTIFGEFGLNKRQFDFWYECCNTPPYYASGLISGNYRKCLPDMKKYFGNDLSHMDNETFNRLLKTIARFHYSSWYGVERIIEDIRVDGKTFFKNISRLLAKYDKEGRGEELLRLINDAVNEYRRISNANRPDINWMFEDYSDVVRTHDSLGEIRRIQEEENRARWNMSEAERRKKEDAKREKVDEERKCYEYEDDNYIIRLPKNVGEIVSEGMKQHICIGGYTSRHSNGDTNLFFLRSKETPDSPFYAIEMDNNKKIVQIHGFGNKWLGNNPEAIPTVIRWLRKNDIDCQDKILTCTAQGYGGNAACIAMPVVD